jgi:hypothetical protein
MNGRPVPSQLDQVLPRFSVQKAGSYHSLGRIRIAPFGKGLLRILWESGYISIRPLDGGLQTFSVAEKNGEQFTAELDVLAALIRARVIRARVDGEEAE